MSDVMRDTAISAEWEQRSADLWASFDSYSEPDFLVRIDELVAALPAEHPVALFERACSLDSTGHSGRAVPLYRQALDGGLTGLRRRRHRRSTCRQGPRQWYGALRAAAS